MTHAVFVLLDENQLSSLSDQGPAVFLFPFELKALSWMISKLEESGELRHADGVWHVRGFDETFDKSTEAFDAWQGSLSSMEFFHCYEVREPE